jgi:hypothetical protein
MAGFKQIRSWFVTTTGDIQQVGFWRRFVGGGISKPTQQTFENLTASVPFFKEIDSIASIDTTTALENKQGLVIVSSDTNAKSGTNTALGSTGGSVVVSPSQLPTLTNQSQVIDDFSDNAIVTDVDGTTTKNNYPIRFKSTFITWLISRIFKSGGTTGQVPVKNSNTNYDWSWGSITTNLAASTGVLPIANGGTGQTTATLAMNAILPSISTNQGRVLGNDGTNITWTVAKYITSSTTNVVIGIGSKSFTIDVNLAYTHGMRCRISSSVDNTYFMDGIIDTYNIGTGALVVIVEYTGGSGTFANWNVNIGNGVKRITSATDTVTIDVTGNKTFHVEAGMSFQHRQRIRCEDSTNSGNFIEGMLVSYNTQTGVLVITADTAGGAGYLTSKSSWIIFECGGITPLTTGINPTYIITGGGTVATQACVVYFTRVNGLMYCWFNLNWTGAAGNFIQLDIPMGTGLISSIPGSIYGYASGTYDSSNDFMVETTATGIKLYRMDGSNFGVNAVTMKGFITYPY